MKPRWPRRSVRRAHEVRIPLLAVGNVDPDGVAAVENVRCRSRRTPYNIWNSNRSRPIPFRSTISIALAISFGSCVARAGMRQRGAIAPSTGCSWRPRRPGSIGDAAGLVDAPLHSRTRPPAANDRIDVGRAAPQGRLDHHAHLGTPRGADRQTSSVASVVVWSSMSKR